MDKVWVVTLEDSDGVISTTVYNERPPHSLIKKLFVDQFDTWGPWGLGEWPGEEQYPTRTVSVGSDKLTCQEYDVDPLPKEFS